ncbi:MAG: matrixin family metalloprotease [Patescibacteria group bacterium]|jgi:predicted Zn-dependent protease
MKRTFTVFLVIFIIIVFGSLAIRYFANSAEQDNWFNREYRSRFSRYSFLRSVYNLHWDGDAAADYLLAGQYTNIKIVLNRYDECAITPADLEPVRLEIERVVQKPGQVTVVDGKLMTLILDGYDRAGIRTIAGKFHESKTAGDTAVLNIYCLNTYTEQPTNIGMTVNEDGVVIFYKTLQRDTGSATALTGTYLTSTILHEFGHQIGLDHGQDPTCLMADTVDMSPLLDSRFAVFTPVAFCESELQRIEEIRNSLYTDKY